MLLTDRLLRAGEDATTRARTGAGPGADRQKGGPRRPRPLRADYYLRTAVSLAYSGANSSGWNCVGKSINAPTRAPLRWDPADPWNGMVRSLHRAIRGEGAPSKPRAADFVAVRAESERGAAALPRMIDAR